MAVFRCLVLRYLRPRRFTEVGGRLNPYLSGWNMHLSHPITWEQALSCYTHNQHPSLEIGAPSIQPVCAKQTFHVLYSPVEKNRF